MAFSFLYGPLSHLYMISGKTMDFASKIMSLLFNMLSTLVKAFLTRSKCLLISWLQSSSAVVLETPKIKSLTVSPSICHEALGQDAIIFIFWMLSLGHHFYSPLSLSFKRQFNSSLSAICIICISEVVDISPRNLDSSLWFIWPGILHDVLCI